MSLVFAASIHRCWWPHRLAALCLLCARTHTHTHAAIRSLADLCDRWRINKSAPRLLALARITRGAREQQRQPRAECFCWISNCVLEELICIRNLREQVSQKVERRKVGRERDLLCWRWKYMENCHQKGVISCLCMRRNIMRGLQKP